ncbi:MAG: cyclase family protein [Bacteroidota bacterium]
MSSPSGQLVDLTLPLQPGMRGVDIAPARTLKADGWNASTLTLYSHCGTHMDAPLHFGVNEQTIDEVPPQRMISEAWVVPLTNLLPGALIKVADMSAIATRIQPGQSVLLRTDWSKQLGQPSYRDGLPRISRELAHWLGEKEVNMLGVEPPSVANVNDLPEVTDIHHILMRNDIIIVEGLTNLDLLTEEKVTLMAFPLKVKGGDGAPARVMAIQHTTG